MQLLEHLRRQFTYDAWANREVLATLKKSSSLSPRPRQLLAHILSAERLWLERIQSRPQSFPVWPDFSFEQCEVQMAELTSLWRTYLDKLAPVEISSKINYKNTKGEIWTSIVEDILTHVLLHSAYHRGQIATEVRAGGEQPAYTDFIQAARQGLLGDDSV
jgi:uncharacterized damage-inducible protein DinB